MKTDIEIANAAEKKPITEIAATLGLKEDDLELYGKYKAKVAAVPKKRKGRLILVTAVNPTAGGEGKTTMSIGLADALRLSGAEVCLALRQPSLGPVFGMKGGAAGGGYSQVLPMDDINLHFTGDFHAITAANNLLSALIDNHLQWGNALNIDSSRIVFKRCQDVNDRALRNVVVGLGGAANGVPREEGFDITAASEIMAVLCLAADLSDLKARLARVIAAYDKNGRPVTAGDLKAQDSMAALLKDAIKPNLVQTIGNTPAFVHGGPFANIAHGCNSVAATNAALSLADYVVTEAGFGADLGAEKFIDIKCRTAGLNVDCVVLVATVRALKLNGGAVKDELKNEDVAALRRGLPNLLRHIENITTVFAKPCVVALNRFDTDTDAELISVAEACRGKGVECFTAEYFARGGAGGTELAAAVKAAADANKTGMTYAYDLKESYAEKVEKLARRVYGADGAIISPKAQKQLDAIVKAGYDHLPVCVAKTQYSFSDRAELLGAPQGFKITVREAVVRAGAGFVVLICGDMLLMPGLPRVPNAEKISISDQGVISGLF